MPQNFLYLPRIHRPVTSIEITPISVSDITDIINEIKDNSSRLIDYPALVTCERQEIDGLGLAVSIKLALKADWVATNKENWACFFPDQKSQENITLAFGVDKTTGCVNEIITDMQPWLFRVVVMLSPTASSKLIPSLEKTDYWIDTASSLFREQLNSLNTNTNINYPGTKAASTLLDSIKSDKNLEFFTLKSEDSIKSWLKARFPGDTELLSTFQPEYPLSKKSNLEITQAKNSLLNYLAYVISTLKKSERSTILTYFFGMVSPKMQEEYSTINPQFKISVPNIYKEKSFKKAMSNNRKLLEHLALQLKLDINSPTFIEEFSDPLSRLSILYVEKEIVRQMQKANILPAESNNFKGTALFVGEGVGKNMLAIQKAYPNLNCYALEPDGESIRMATVFGTRKNQQFHTTLDLVPEECFGTFDMIFVLHYNIRFSQTDFFQRASDLLKLNGTIIVGKAMSDAQHISSNLSIGELLKQSFTAFSLPGWTNGVPDLEFKQALYQAVKTDPKIQSRKDLINQTPLEQWLNNKNRVENKAIQESIRELNKEPLKALNPPNNISEALTTFGLLAPTKQAGSDSKEASDLESSLSNSK